MLTWTLFCIHLSENYGSLKRLTFFFFFFPEISYEHCLEFLIIEKKNDVTLPHYLHKDGHKVGIQFSIINVSRHSWGEKKTTTKKNNVEMNYSI